MLHLLHVEDSDNDHDLVRYALDKALPNWSTSVELRRARTFAEGVAQVHEQHPHLIVLDLNLPGRTGHQLLRQLKEHETTRRIPVVVLTNSEDHRDIVMSYDNHAAAYLTKPRTFAALVDMLSAIDAFWFRQAALPGQLPASR